MGKIMKRLTIIFRFLLICSLAFVNSACAKQTESQIRAEASYAKLCKVYEDVKSQPLSANESADMLVIRLRQGVPKLDELVGHVFNAARSDVYDLYKQAAKIDTGTPWDCPAIKAYYQKKWIE